MAITITTQARRLAAAHNSDRYRSGDIYWVELDTGRIRGWVSSYAAEQPPLADRKESRRALLRIGHGKLSHVEAQRFLDELGEGF